MPKVSLSIPHSLGQEEASKRLHGLIEKLKDRYGDKASNVTENWSGDNLDFGFTAYGFKIKGAMNVESSEVRVQGDIPLAAAMFKGRVEQEVRDTLERILA